MKCHRRIDRKPIEIWELDYDTKTILDELKALRKIRSQNNRRIISPPPPDVKPQPMPKASVNRQTSISTGDVKPEPMPRAKRRGEK